MGFGLNELESQESIARYPPGHIFRDVSIIWGKNHYSHGVLKAEHLH